MCIAIVSPAGVKCPTLDTLKTCFLNNDDGAGWAYPLPNGRGVKIMKGFMTWKDFSNAWTEFGKHYDTEALPLLIHFRISTGAGVVPSMTHPFPINYDDGALQKITYVSDYAVIHNGIISCVGYNERPKHLSDTAVFCKEYLPLMVKMSPDWLHHDETMQLIHKMIDSKMAIMDKTGFINMTEGFEEWEGNFYSNTTYKENRYRSSKYRAPQNWYHSYDDDDDYYGYGYDSCYSSGIHHYTFNRNSDTVVNSSNTDNDIYDFTHFDSDYNDTERGLMAVKSGWTISWDGMDYRMDSQEEADNYFIDRKRNVWERTAERVRDEATGEMMDKTLGYTLVGEEGHIYDSNGKEQAWNCSVRVDTTMFED